MRDVAVRRSARETSTYMCICKSIMNPKLRKLEKKYFKSWKAYSRTKLHMQQYLRKAVYFNNIRVKQNALNSLLINCNEAKKYRSFYVNLKIELTDRPEVRRRILKQAFHAWLLYLRKRQRLKVLDATITKFHTDKLQSKFIRIWRVICLELKRTTELEKKAFEFHRHLVLRKSLRSWMQFQGQRVREKSQWNTAILHRSRNILAKIWFAWNKYSNIRIVKARRVREALKFYEMKLLVRTFRMITTIAHKRTTKKLAKKHYAKKLVYRIFVAWNAQHRRTIKIEEKISTLHNKLANTSKQKAFKQWRLWVWTSKCDRRRDKNSTDHYKKKLIRRTLVALKNYLRYRNEKAVRSLYLKDPLIRISMMTKKLYINKWTMALIIKVRETQKFQRAMEHSFGSTIKHYFARWKVATENHKVKGHRKNDLLKIGSYVLLSKYTSLWHEKYQEAAVMHRKLTWASSIFARNIKNRLFEHWKLHVVNESRKKWEINEAMKFHRKVLIREGLKDTLRMCLYRTESRYENRLKYAKKNSVHDFEILRQYLDRWLAFVYDNGINKYGKESSAIGNGRVCRVPYSSAMPTRFVLPEYMRKQNLELVG